MPKGVCLCKSLKTEKVSDDDDGINDCNLLS